MSKLTFWRGVRKQTRGFMRWLLLARAAKVLENAMPHRVDVEGPDGEIQCVIFAESREAYQRNFTVERRYHDTDEEGMSVN